MKDFGKACFRLCRGPDTNQNAHALPYIEHVLIRRAIRILFLLVGVAVQVDNVDPVERVQQMPPHPSERRVIEIAVVGDITKYTLFIFLDEMLTEAYEFHIVVV